MSWDPCWPKTSPWSALWHSACPAPGWCPSGSCSNACLVQEQIPPTGHCKPWWWNVGVNFLIVGSHTPLSSTQLLRHAVSQQMGEKGPACRAPQFCCISWHLEWMSRVRGLCLISHPHFPFLWVSVSQIKNLNNLLWLQSILSNGKLCFKWNSPRNQIINFP